MLTKGIDTTIRDLIAQLPKGLNAGATSTDDFEKLIAPLAAQISSAIIAASAQQTAGVSASTAGQTTGASGQAKTGLSAFQLSVLRDQDAPRLEQLDGLAAGDEQYNQREQLLRNRLDLWGLEHRLQESARDMHVTYDRSDLDGVLRHAGYDASHMGSSDRYMSAIERYVGEAENRYKERAANVPGQMA